MQRERDFVFGKIEHQTLGLPGVGEFSFPTQGWIQWGDLSLKTYENTFSHHVFLQFRKQYSRYKAVLSSTVLSQQSCEVYFIYLTVLAKAL